MAGTQQRSLTVSVESDEQSRARSLAAARRIDKSEGYQGEFYSFENWSLLFQVFSPKRWELIAKLHEIGPSSLRGLARALDRDVKRVHEDAEVLLTEGIIERNEQNKLIVPFARIHLEADLISGTAATAA